MAYKSDNEVYKGDTIMIKMYLVNILLGVDQLLNVIMLGDPDETISSRCGRVFPDSAITHFIDAIFFWKKDHCQRAIEQEGYRDILFPREKNNG